MKRSLELVSLALIALLTAATLALAGPRLATPAPFDAPAAALPAKGCKYKTDGTGNCLSPAFYKCQKDWTKCSDACKGNLKCLDKCEVKYAAICGD